MNRHNDGTPLNRDDLLKIAKDSGVTDGVLDGTLGLHNTNLINSKLNEITASVRFDMMMSGKLLLNTRNLVRNG